MKIMLSEGGVFCNSGSVGGHCLDENFSFANLFNLSNAGNVCFGNDATNQSRVDEAILISRIHKINYIKVIILRSVIGPRQL